MREAFGPVIDRLAANGIDLTKMPVEVAPIAHYHMGGIAADAQMQTDLPGLFAAGEAVGGANGANRLSGNAITEALVFGRRAGRSAADYAKRTSAIARSCRQRSGGACVDRRRCADPRLNTAEMLQTLQTTMQDDVGALRSEAKITARPRHHRPPDRRTRQLAARRRQSLRHAADRLVRLAQYAAGCPRGRRGCARAHRNPRRATARGLSAVSPDWAFNQFVRLRDGAHRMSGGPRAIAAAAS